MTDRAAKTMKDALYNTVHHHRTLSVAAIAEEIGMAESYLYRSCLPEAEDGGSASGVRFPMKKLIPLTKATGDYQLIDYIERVLSRVAVPIPAATTSSCRDIRDHALQSAAEFGDLMREVNNAGADDAINEDERLMIQKEGWEAIQAIMQVIQACK